MPCRICLSDSRVDAFKTGRVAICRSCITLLNTTSIAPAKAETILDNYLRQRLRSWDLATSANPTAWKPWQVEAAHGRQQSPETFEQHFRARRTRWLNELAKGKRTEQLSSEELDAIKVVRACRRKLLRADPERRANYPKDWPVRSAKVRTADGEKCKLCGQTWERDVTDLHVHHIIHKWNGGSHNPNNLVTLCHRHHNHEHPDQTFSAKSEAPGSRMPVQLVSSTCSVTLSAATSDIRINDEKPGEPRHSQSLAPYLPTQNTDAFWQHARGRAALAPRMAQERTASSLPPTHPPADTMNEEKTHAPSAFETVASNQPLPSRGPKSPQPAINPESLAAGTSHPNGRNELLVAAALSANASTLARRSALPRKRSWLATFAVVLLLFAAVTLFLYALLFGKSHNSDASVAPNGNPSTNSTVNETRAP
ncbi:MAG: HNH endonuclease [Pigmentiphaga sp.]|uniref:HNH endonuclease n=1 Tax=Pigmentiphaga sp. TaxID=1977564 RepID=UPI0029A25AF4|nr:HNH endonuclease [Pigmentiphaga sp.]